MRTFSPVKFICETTLSPGHWCRTFSVTNVWCWSSGFSLFAARNSLKAELQQVCPVKRKTLATGGRHDIFGLLNCLNQICHACRPWPRVFSFTGQTLLRPSAFRVPPGRKQAERPELQHHTFVTEKVLHGGRVIRVVSGDEFHRGGTRRLPLETHDQQAQKLGTAKVAKTFRCSAREAWLSIDRRYAPIISSVTRK